MFKYLSKLKINDINILLIFLFMNLLTIKNKWTYISLIKKYPKGIPNRLEKYDKWVASWKTPPINTYYDYFKNG